MIHTSMTTNGYVYLHLTPVTMLTTDHTNRY